MLLVILCRMCIQNMHASKFKKYTYAKKKLD